jgi:hypothetical protein
MLTTRHVADFPSTTAELQAIFRLAHVHDQVLGGRYGVRPAADRSEWLPAVQRQQLACASLEIGEPRAWWPDLSEDLP